MKEIVVVLPSATDQISSITASPISPIVQPQVSIGIPGPQGPPGPGIASNITRVTASTTPPTNPVVNDLWIDLS
jgi:hypothetical protein